MVRPGQQSQLAELAQNGPRRNPKSDHRLLVVAAAVVWGNGEGPRSGRFSITCAVGARADFLRSRSLAQPAPAPAPGRTAGVRTPAQRSVLRWLTTLSMCASRHQHRVHTARVAGGERVCAASTCERRPGGLVCRVWGPLSRGLLLEGGGSATTHPTRAGPLLVLISIVSSMRRRQRPPA